MSLLTCYKHTSSKRLHFFFKCNKAKNNMKIKVLSKTQKKKDKTNKKLMMMVSMKKISNKNSLILINKYVRCNDNRYKCMYRRQKRDSCFFFLNQCGFGEIFLDRNYIRRIVKC